MKLVVRVAAAVTAALIFAGCAPSQPDYSAEPVSANMLRAGMSAEAEFHAPDEKTTGRVKVTLTESDTSPGELDARLEFMDFSSEHEQLTVGGTVEPRGDEECFSGAATAGEMRIGSERDDRLRVGGGTFNPSSFDVEADIGMFPATLSPSTGYGLYEIVLHDSTSCGRILAAAALDWGV